MKNQTILQLVRLQLTSALIYTSPKLWILILYEAYCMLHFPNFSLFKYCEFVVSLCFKSTNNAKVRSKILHKLYIYTDVSRQYYKFHVVATATWEYGMPRICPRDRSGAPVLEEELGCSRNPILKSSSVWQGRIGPHDVTLGRRPQGVMTELTG